MSLLAIPQHLSLLSSKKMNEATTEVWYQLVEENGAISSCASVDITKTTSIAKFRDAVKEKNPNKLSHCDASDLVVYANRDAFNSIPKTPLEEDLAVSG